MERTFEQVAPGGFFVCEASVGPYSIVVIELGFWLQNKGLSSLGSNVPEPLVYKHGQ